VEKENTRVVMSGESPGAFDKQVGMWGLAYPLVCYVGRYRGVYPVVSYTPLKNSPSQHKLVPYQS
jgi:hypothetical protein